MHSSKLSYVQNERDVIFIFLSIYLFFFILYIYLFILQRGIFQERGIPLIRKKYKSPFFHEESIYEISEPSMHGSKVMTGTKKRD